jgi:hypothetical protein
MPMRQEPTSAAAGTTENGVPDVATDDRGGRFARNSVIFVLIGLVLYGGLYVASEQLVHRFARRNRFFMISSAPRAHYDYVLLGASHAAVFDFDDMNARLEQTTGASVLNLAIVGAGVTVNRLVLDYFLARRETSGVIYVVDSFGFYSPQWNEERLNDTRLFLRAPFDLTLGRLLMSRATTPWAGLNYLLGFAKINNPDRFSLDVSEDEVARFNRTYRPVPQIDRERVAYLYPSADESIRRRYFEQFEDLVRTVQERGMRFIILKPPIPQRVYRMIPGEADFDLQLKALADRHSVSIHDFSQMCNDDKFFFDTDHLNKIGVVNFFEQCLKGRLN